MNINEAGLDLIKSFEGYKLTGYLCPSGIPTIGYGHTGTTDGKSVYVGMKITQAKANKLLKDDLEKFEKTVSKYVTVPITSDMFSALVSFTYNVGAGNLQKSTLLKKLNAYDYIGAANQFDVWNKANGVVLAGLTKRRAAEKKLFLTDMCMRPTCEITNKSASILEVMWIQTKLKITIDGKWGSGTASAIKKKNESIGLKSGDGYTCTTNLIKALAVN